MLDKIQSAATTLGNKVVSAINNSGPARALNAASQLQSMISGSGGTTSYTPNLGMPGSSLIPNPLHEFSSYNYNFTLSLLEDNSLNFPDDTYRSGIFGPILLKTGSGMPDNRIPTIYKYPDNPNGLYDFFLEDLKITQIIGFNQATGNTNATGLTFRIIEPYSMGMFFQVLQIAARDAGHTNYLDAPLLLTIEFKGHLNPEMQNVVIPIATKHIPIKLMLLSMRVTTSGTEYDVSARPSNEQAYSTIYNQFKADMSIAGRTVVEMLQTGERSLQVELNKVLKNSVDKKSNEIPDQILISFPDPLIAGGVLRKFDDTASSTATVDPSKSAESNVKNKLKLQVSSLNGTLIQDANTINALGISDMGFNELRTGDIPFAKDNLTYDEKTGTYVRGNVTIDPSLSEFRFASGGDVVNAINQVILMSDYARTALANVTNDGFIRWWRVEAHAYYMTTDLNIGKTGTKPKLINFRVVPYYADASIFSANNQAKPGIAETKAQVIKEYNYIYTGKNIDVLDFNIDFKAGFYTALNADFSKNNKDVVQAPTTGLSTPSEADIKKETLNNTQISEGSSTIKPGQLPTRTHNDRTRNDTSTGGGGGKDDSATIAAKQFHSALTSGVDMVALDLTILGDPYFMGDSGMGNYSAGPGPNRYINADGAINWDKSEIHVNLNFKTPVDINLTSGMYEFTNSENVPQFSGLYRVFKAESNFSGGKFTQTLNMFRMRNQESDSVSSATIVTPVPIPKTAERIVAEQNVITTYGTNENSQQTSLLAEQEEGFN